jgi:hypothetical protein
MPLASTPSHLAGEAPIAAPPPPKSTSPEPVRLVPRGDGPAPLVFRRGAHAPFAVRWYGITSLFGHARHFIASAIASEQVDSRDWMHPDAPSELLARVVRVLGGNEHAPTLVQAMGRPVWVDFIADTGDDRDVSAAVGRMLFRDYVSEERTLPRGEVLLVGGDTAYPVATSEEIFRRVIAPWNETLREKDGQRRVLIGIPGNHDWYDGLDGFARMFRRSAEPVQEADTAPPSQEAKRKKRRRLRPLPIRLRSKEGRKTGFVARQLHLDEVGGLLGILLNLWKSVRAFVAGGGVSRRKRLVLTGYEPVQDSSYWTLPLAEGLDVWGVDRQLGRLDFRQRSYFRQRRKARPDGRIIFVAPDPAIAYGERYENGARMLQACKLSMEKDRVFYLCGDAHHYERRPLGDSLHLIAGGGGAFLHGTRISASPSGPAARAYPNAAMTRALVAQVPVKLMLGHGGFLVHAGLALIASMELGASAQGLRASAVTTALVTMGLVAMMYFIAGHHRAHAKLVAMIALLYGVGLGVAPTLLRGALPRAIPALASDGAVMLVYAFGGALAFGLFLATVATLGLEHEQAFTVLAHPGFKHFVRMCVHPGGKIEAWAIGKDDTLAPGDPVLIDEFVWPPEK